LREAVERDDEQVELKLEIALLASLGGPPLTVSSSNPV
jgi:hypothetical protein